jgi:hypothetical protein
MRLFFSDEAGNFIEDKQINLDSDNTTLNLLFSRIAYDCSYSSSYYIEQTKRVAEIRTTVKKYSEYRELFLERLKFKLSNYVNPIQARIKDKEETLVIKVLKMRLSGAENILNWLNNGVETDYSIQQPTTVAIEENIINNGVETDYSIQQPKPKKDKKNKKPETFESLFSNENDIVKLNDTLKFYKAIDDTNTFILRKNEFVAVVDVCIDAKLIPDISFQHLCKLFAEIYKVSIANSTISEAKETQAFYDMKEKLITSLIS